MMGCAEVALVAETSGCLKLTPACCATVNHSRPSAERSIHLAAEAAAHMGGNAVLILYVDQQQKLQTDCEGVCCSVEGFRAYGVAYSCPLDMLEWHLKHETNAASEEKAAEQAH